MLDTQTAKFEDWAVECFGHNWRDIDNIDPVTCQHCGALAVSDGVAKHANWHQRTEGIGAGW